MYIKKKIKRTKSASLDSNEYGTQGDSTVGVPSTLQDFKSIAFDMLDASENNFLSTYYRI